VQQQGVPLLPQFLAPRRCPVLVGIVLQIVALIESQGRVALGGVAAGQGRAGGAREEVGVEPVALGLRRGVARDVAGDGPGAPRGRRGWPGVEHEQRPLRPHVARRGPRLVEHGAQAVHGDAQGGGGALRVGLGPEQVDGLLARQAVSRRGEQALEEGRDGGARPAGGGYKLVTAPHLERAEGLHAQVWPRRRVPRVSRILHGRRRIQARLPRGVAQQESVVRSLPFAFARDSRQVHVHDRCRGQTEQGWRGAAGLGRRLPTQVAGARAAALLPARVPIGAVAGQAGAAGGTILLAAPPILLAIGNGRIRRRIVGAHDPSPSFHATGRLCRSVDHIVRHRSRSREAVSPLPSVPPHKGCPRPVTLRSRGRFIVSSSTPWGCGA